MTDYGEKTDGHNKENSSIEHYKKKLRIRWWINAIGWWILGATVVLNIMFENKLVFCIGFIAAVSFIIAGIIFGIIHRLNRCPYCGGFILKRKCLS